MMHARLARLETLAQALAQDGDLVAVLGLGSSGAQHHRFDDHSDIDFFLVTVDALAKERYLADIDWLAPMGNVTYEFAHDANGRKALFSDGLFVEYAIFTMTQLQAVPFLDARIIWQRPGSDISAGAMAGEFEGAGDDTVDLHLNEALTNLLVGVQRELRGERLSAFRFIQVFAVDHVLAITRLTARNQPSSQDPFDPTRRLENRYPALHGDLPRMLQGYEKNMVAAEAVLSWLSRHCAPDPVIAAHISSQLASPGPEIGRRRRAAGDATAASPGRRTQ